MLLLPLRRYGCRQRIVARETVQRLRVGPGIKDASRAPGRMRQTRLAKRRGDVTVGGAHDVEEHVQVVAVEHVNELTDLIEGHLVGETSSDRGRGGRASRSARWHSRGWPGEGRIPGSRARTLSGGSFSRSVAADRFTHSTAETFRRSRPG